MSTSHDFSGVIAPVLTPFDEQGNPDASRFLDHARWLLADGCTGLAPFGTTGEANSLGIQERKDLLEALIDGGIDPALLMPGTGVCALSDTVELSRHAVEQGCGGVMVLPPFYYKAVNDDGLFAYFSEVIERVGDDRLRIYLYHIPPVAQVGFSLELVGRLIEAFPQTVVGLKDSSGDWSNTKALLDAYPGFTVFPGSEIFLLAGLRNGAAGCITATGNVNARMIRNLYDNWQSDQADALQAEITAVRETIQARPMIPMLKAIVAHYRNDPVWARLRPPFLPLAAQDAQAGIAELSEKFGFALKAA
ncbi:MAG: dihydrodipicolinate synthase family protein [Alphaproteobacteria bacterium]|nr:MAG: dihydrodipicolinate synthase family protein [Alphaproteobacteria bacterium]